MRISEIYTSIQGECEKAGKPTVFVRTGGCNLRCALWPCDTPYAVDPKLYRHEWQKVEPLELVDDVLKIAKGNVRNICFTGGEPFLQPNDELKYVAEQLRFHYGFSVEFFSNGTLLYPEFVQNPSFTINMDWKLPGSGEDPNNLNRIENYKKMHDLLHVKFTIADRKDYETARDLMYAFNMTRNVYMGVVWGKLTDKELIEWVMEEELPVSFTMQIHNHIWDRTQRGI